MMASLCRAYLGHLVLILFFNYQDNVIDNEDDEDYKE